jgi:pyrroloquinoline quinone biosynthesis protein B
MVRTGDSAYKARTQAQVAVCADGHSWFLLGASPDLRSQIENSPDLHPKAVRSTPIGGVILAGADLDHVLGLLVLRELQPLNVYATESVIAILRNNVIFGMLNRIPRQVSWNSFELGKDFAVSAPGRTEAAFTVEAISVSKRYPAYVRDHAIPLNESEAVVGLIIRTQGRSLAYLPNAGCVTPGLIEKLMSVDLLLFDGTFWSDDELVRIQGNGETARQMGHLPVSGPQGSLELLNSLPMRKIYIHINNTNPMLNQNGPECRQVREAGWQIAEDGWQLHL